MMPLFETIPNPPPRRVRRAQARQAKFERALRRAALIRKDGQLATTPGAFGIAARLLKDLLRGR